MFSLTSIIEYATWIVVAEVIWWASVGYIVWSVNRLHKRLKEIPVEYL